MILSGTDRAFASNITISLAISVSRRPDAGPRALHGVYLGLALLPPLAGFVRDATGAPAAPLLTAAGFLALCLTALGVYAAAIRSRIHVR